MTEEKGLEKKIKKEQILEFFKGIGTILLFYTLGTVASLIFYDLNQNDNFIIATLSQIGTYMIIIVTLAIIYRKRLIEDAKKFKKENISIAFKNWILGLIVMAIANLIITSIIGNIAANESANRELLKQYPISNILIMVLIGPMVEEITFRASFKKAFTKWYTFAIVTGFLFGFAHVAEFNLLEFLFIIPYGALGFFFAKAFYETDNIYTSFICHMLHNAMCVALIILM